MMNAEPHRREMEPTPAAFPSEARAKLAAAIAVAHDANRSENEAKEVANRLKVQGWEAANCLEAATKAVEEARNMLAMRSAKGSSVLGDRLLKNALDAEIQAKAALDQSVAQREEARLILSDAQFQARKAAEQVPKAARVVVMDVIEHLLQEAAAAQEALVKCRLVLRNAVSHARDPSKVSDSRLQGAIDFLKQLDVPSMNDPWDWHLTSQRWATFFRDLQEDATAPIPE